MDRALEILVTVKNFIVQLCQRFCFSFDDDDSVVGNSQTGERARLLATDLSISVDDGSQESLQGQESNYYNSRQLLSKTTSGSVPKPKNDDQSALKEILSNMANDILDVTVFNQQLNQTIETGDYQERSHQYGKRLNKEAANLVSRHSDVLLKPTATSKASGVKAGAAAGLAEMSTGEVWSDLGIADTDTMLIDEVVTRVKESSGPPEFHFRNIDQVLARFEPRIVEDGDNIDLRS